MLIKNKVALSAACLAIALSIGCKKEESATSAPQPQPQAQAQPESQAQPPAGSTYSASLPPALAGKTIAPGGKAWLDSVNKNSIDKIVNVKSEDGFELSGWAFNDGTKSVPSAIFIELAPVKGEGKYYATAKRTDRHDVAKIFKEPSYKKCGFMSKADIKSVPAGEYQINIIQVVDGNPILVSTKKKVNKTN